MKNDFLIISDVHLEKKNVTEQNFILDSINEKIENYKKQGVSPVVICAGDIHNGNKGLPWLEKINAQVVYLCGNHEFWEHDYDEVINSIKNNAPNNVNFLHNDFVVIGNNIYLGGTLWSDIGESLNPDLIHVAQNIMNDNYTITYKSWYKKEENIDKVKNLYNDYQSEPIIEKKLWNVWAEREENQKTTTFFNSFIQVYNILEQIPETINKLKDSLQSKYDFNKIDQETYDKSLYNLNAYKENISFEDWIFQNNKLLGLENKRVIEITPETEAIFSKLKNYDVSKLKLVVVSHHLPFLEERLIGRQEWFDEDINKKYYNDVLDSIYSLRKGLNYPIHNYFWRISKGEITKEESITQIIHYNNDGSNNLNPLLIEKADCWIHGHEHHYNYEDILKGIKVATNPLSHSMAVFTFKEGKIGLNNGYKTHHNVQDEQKEIDKLKNTFLRVVNTDLDKKQLNKAIKLWALKSFAWDDYSTILNYLEKLNKKLFKILLKNPEWERVMTETETLNVNMLIDSIDFSINKLEIMEKRINEGVCLRKDPEFSFNVKYANALDNEHIENYFKLVTEPLIKINRSLVYNGQWDYSSWMRNAFINMSYIELNKKEFNKTKTIIGKFKFQRINEITPQWIVLFEKAFNNKKSIFKFEIDRKIQADFFDLQKQYQPERLKRNEEELRKRLDF